MPDTINKATSQKIEAGVLDLLEPLEQEVSQIENALDLGPVPEEALKSVDEGKIGAIRTRLMSITRRLRHAKRSVEKL